MELTDILPVEDWIQFEKELHDRFNLNCTVYNASGIGITGKPYWCNRLCPEIKANKESLAVICAAGNQNFMAQAKKSKQPVVGECDAGLLKIAVPIFVDGEFLGTAGGCGRPPEGGEVETFIIQKTTEMDEDEINALCRELVPMSAEQANQAAEFIEKRISELIADYVRQSSESS
jgi:ligand-binding sensor protein